MSSQHTPVAENNRERLRRLLRVGTTHVGQGVFAARRLKSGIVIGEILGQAWTCRAAGCSNRPHRCDS